MALAGTQRKKRKKRKMAHAGAQRKIEKEKRKKEKRGIMDISSFETSRRSCFAKRSKKLISSTTEAITEAVLVEAGALPNEPIVFATQREK